MRCIFGEKNMKPTTIYGLIIAFSVMMQTSCDSDGPLSPGEQSIPYFPLQIGNTWHYKLNHNPDWQWTFQIVDTAQIAGLAYFVCERRFGQTSQPDTVYYRTGGDHIVYERPLRGEEIILVDYSKPVGQDVQSGTGFYTITQKKLTQTVPAGTFTDCIAVAFDPAPQAIDDEHAHVYAPQVGIIQISGQIGHMQLTAAFVNGLVYPKAN